MKICVYCSSEEEINPAYLELGEAFGREMGRRGHSLVYGGYGKGIMGAVARGVATEQGEIIAVMPEIFDNRPNFLFEGCTTVLRSKELSDRKMIMQQESDAFVALPGGIGTLDELFDTVSVKSVGRLDKPIAVYNMLGCYDGLDALMSHLANENMIPPRKQNLMQFYTTAEALLDALE